MIDRKVFGISGAILLVLIAAAVWQLNQFHHTLNGLTLFALFSAPATLLIMMTMAFIQWLMSPEENLPSLRRFHGRWIVSWSVFFALVQTFAMAGFLGLVSRHAASSGRPVLVLIGIILILTGNILPKFPSPPQRSSPLGLNPWQWNRFTGKLLVGMGLVFVLGGILLPLEWWKPVFPCLVLAALAALIWYGFKRRHERLLK
jgi:hypothetical protein